jgi:hypothetical protein
LHREFVARAHAAYFNGRVLYTLNKVDVLDGVDQRLVADLGGAREALAWVFGNPFAMLSYRLGFAPLLVVFTIMIIYAFSIAWSLTVFFLLSLGGALASLAAMDLREACGAALPPLASTQEGWPTTCVFRQATLNSPLQ